MRNEAASLPKLLATIAEQERLDSIACIAFVDGRSEDASREIVRSWQERISQIRLIDNPARITPVAFNLGIDACLEAGSTAIVILSAHSWLHSGFFRGVVQLLELDQADIYGAVHDYPPPASPREAAVQAFSDSPLGRRLGRLRSLQKPIETDVAFCATIQRRVFDKIGKFDPGMVRNQDNDFTTRARQAGFRIITDPRLRYTYAPRTSLRQLARQMRGNGTWVGQRPGVHNFRHLAPALFWAALVASVILAIVLKLWWLPLVCAVPYLAAVVVESLRWVPSIGLAAAWLPLMFISAHASYAFGTLSGLLKPRSAS
jgi:hypothetical protein